MTDFSIPCETFLRLSKVLTRNPDLQPSWNTLRYDNGCLVVSDRRFMAIEQIGSAAGIAHIIADEALLAQCEVEAKFNSRLAITVNEMLGFAVGKTSLGYVTPSNLLYTGEVDAGWTRWRDIVLQCQEPAKKPNGGMFWDIEGISRLAASSPSGLIVFEEVVDTNRPTLIRDIKDYQWLGVFHPNSSQDHYSAAALPSWMVPA